MASAVPPQPARAARVLVVDDEPGMLNLTRLLIEDEFPGIQVLGAVDGPEGLAVLGREAVDVIVSDFRMPDMDGLTFLEQAHGVRPSGRILLTALADPEVRARAQRAGVTFIEKSAGPQAMLDAVRRALP